VKAAFIPDMATQHLEQAKTVLVSEGVEHLSLSARYSTVSCPGQYDSLAPCGCNIGSATGSCSCGTSPSPEVALIVIEHVF
jgi:hypothetical protein